MTWPTASTFKRDQCPLRSDAIGTGDSQIRPHRTSNLK